MRVFSILLGFLHWLFALLSGTNKQCFQSRDKVRKGRTGAAAAHPTAAGLRKMSGFCSSQVWKGKAAHFAVLLPKGEYPLLSTWLVSVPLWLVGKVGGGFQKRSAGSGKRIFSEVVAQLLLAHKFAKRFRHALLQLQKESCWFLKRPWQQQVFLWQRQNFSATFL